MHRIRLVVFALLVSWPVGAGAQIIPREPDLEKVRLLAGPLAVNPSLTLSNLGVDTNVFNDPDEVEPRSDFTAAVTPRADLWLRMGRTWVVGTVREDLVWYKEYASERSANMFYTAGWLVPLNRLTMYIAGDVVDALERPGFEIDARVDRTEHALDVAGEVRLSSRTFPGFRASRRSVRFDEGEAFLGSSLTGLNRTRTVLGATLRHELTPLTTLAFDVARELERFEEAPDRDADSTHVQARVRFDPVALISGSADVGFRDFRPASPDLPDYRGMTAAVRLSYTALEITRISAQVARDVGYSYAADQPYYLQTGFSGTVEQRIHGQLDAVARAGHHRLAYRQRQGIPVVVPDRVDRVRLYGAGIGYRVRQDFRIGFDADHQARTSELDGRGYSGLRFGMSLTYGQ